MNVGKKDVVIFQIEDMLSRMDRDRVESFGAHFDNGHDFIELMENVLELLKEQEAVKPKLVGVNIWRCGKCGALIGWEDFTRSGLELVECKFCPECGRAVRWE